MKKIISLIVVITIFTIIVIPSYSETLPEMAEHLTLNLPEEPGEVADYVHNALMNEFDNELFVCALMGNFAKESKMCPGRWEGDAEDDISLSEPYNSIINEDLKFPTIESRDFFSHFGLIPGHYGFGLAQWTAIGRKEMLYDFAVSEGKDIDDVTMQVDFIIWELNNRYSFVVEDNIELEALETITINISSAYEKTHCGELNMAYRYGYAAYYYEQYTGEKYIPSSF